MDGGRCPLLAGAVRLIRDFLVAKDSVPRDRPTVAVPEPVPGGVHGLDHSRCGLFFEVCPTGGPIGAIAPGFGLLDVRMWQCRMTGVASPFSAITPSQGHPDAIQSVRSTGLLSNICRPPP